MKHKGVTTLLIILVTLGNTLGENSLPKVINAHHDTYRSIILSHNLHEQHRNCYNGLQICEGTPQDALSQERSSFVGPQNATWPDLRDHPWFIGHTAKTPLHQYPQLNIPEVTVLQAPYIVRGIEQ